MPNLDHFIVKNNNSKYIGLDLLIVKTLEEKTNKTFFLCGIDYTSKPFLSDGYVLYILKLETYSQIKNSIPVINKIMEDQGNGKNYYRITKNVKEQFKI